MSNKDVYQTASEMVANGEVEFDYIEEAQCTLSTHWFGEYVGRTHFETILKDAIEALQRLDQIKKLLFYGRGILDNDGNIIAAKPDFEHCGEFGGSEFKEVVIHGIIGKATESGELLELLAEWLESEGELDVVNLREEVGDGFWYDAILAKACGFTFGEAQVVNIAKLRARFPNKFAAYDANNRNLDEERKILSKGIDSAE